LVLTRNAFDCREYALQGHCQTLEELVADTKEGDWAITGCRIQIFTRLINVNHFCFPPDLWDRVSHHDSEEEFGQLRESTRIQVLQEFNVNLIIAWSSCRFCLLKRSRDLVRCNQGRIQKYGLGGVKGCMGSRLLPSPFPSPPPSGPLPLPVPPLPLEVGPLIQLGGLGERSKLPQRGLGRSPSRN